MFRMGDPLSGGTGTGSEHSQLRSFLSVPVVEEISRRNRIHRLGQLARHVDPHGHHGVHTHLVRPVGFALRKLEIGQAETWLRAGHSILRFASRTTLPHFSISSLMRAANSSGVLATVLEAQHRKPLPDVGPCYALGDLSR